VFIYWKDLLKQFWLIRIISDLSLLLLVLLLLLLLLLL